MTKVVGVRVEGNQRVYNCIVGRERLDLKSQVILERDGYEYFGEVARTAMDIPERYLSTSVYRFLRFAEANDLKERAEKREREKEGLQFAISCAQAGNLEMNFIDSYIDEQDNKFLFYFLADERIDFRELVKQLAYRYRMRIELRQVGARDKARLYGGVGVCGQEQCCSRFLTSYPQVSIKVAKEQNMAVSSVKSTGNCGRLLCCLQYEQNWYEEAAKKMPRLGYSLETIYGKGVVKSINLQREIVQIQLDSAKDSDPWQVVKLKEITDQQFLAKAESDSLEVADNIFEEAFNEVGDLASTNRKTKNCACQRANASQANSQVTNPLKEQANESEAVTQFSCKKRSPKSSVYIKGQTYEVLAVYDEQISADLETKPNKPAKQRSKFSFKKRSPKEQ